MKRRNDILAKKEKRIQGIVTAWGKKVIIKILPSEKTTIKTKLLLIIDLKVLRFYFLGVYVDYGPYSLLSVITLFQPPEEQQFEPYHRAISAAAFNTGTMLRSAATVITQVKFIVLST